MTKLFLRMENDNMSATAADPQGSMAVEADARVDAEAVTAAAADVTSVDTGIDNAMEAEGEVAAATDTMSEAVADGDGLSPREAEMVEARLERAAKLVGADLGAMGLTFRRESFGGRESRLSVTKMRLEAAEGFGTRIWEAIKKGWQWLMDAAKNLFASLTKSAESQVERFKTLKTRVSEIKGEKKESKMKAGVATFSIAGAASIETINAMIAMGDSYDAMYATAQEKLDPTRANTNNSNKSEQSMLVITTAFGKEETISVTDVAKDGAKAYGRFPGGRSIVVTPSNANGISSFKFNVTKIDEKIAEDYASLDKEELTALVNAGAGMATKLKTFKSNQPRVEKIISTNMKYIDEMISINSSHKDGDDEATKTERTEKFDKVRAHMATAQSLTKLMTSEIPTSYFKIVSGVGDVVQAGIGNFKVKD